MSREVAADLRRQAAKLTGLAAQLEGIMAGCTVAQETARPLEARLKGTHPAPASWPA